jgi:hypothetical protein
LQPLHAHVSTLCLLLLRLSVCQHVAVKLSLLAADKEAVTLVLHLSCSHCLLNNMHLYCNTAVGMTQEKCAKTLLSMGFETQLQCTCVTSALLLIHRISKGSYLYH